MLPSCFELEDKPITFTGRSLTWKSWELPEQGQTCATIATLYALGYVVGAVEWNVEAFHLTVQQSLNLEVGLDQPSFLRGCMQAALSHGFDEVKELEPSVENVKLALLRYNVPVVLAIPGHALVVYGYNELVLFAKPGKSLLPSSSFKAAMVGLLQV